MRLKKSEKKMTKTREVRRKRTKSRRDTEKEVRRKPKKEAQKKTQERGPKANRERSPKEIGNKSQLSTTKTRDRIKRLKNRLRNPALSITVPHNYMRIHPRRSLHVYIHRSLAPCLCDESLSVATVEYAKEKSVPFWAIAHRSQHLADLTIPPSSASSASESKGSQQR